MASPNYSEILATTLKNYADEITDNVSDQVAFYNECNKRGKIKLISGGDTIVIPLEYAENGTYQRYSGWETLDVSPTDVISAANYDWKQVAISVSMSGLELLKNAGKERIFNLMESKVENAKHTFANNFSTDLYSDGQIQIYDDRTYDRVVKKVRRKQITELTHPFFKDNPEFIEVANEALLEGFDLEEILLLFMMTER